MEEKKVLYSAGVIDFVTVAVEFCKYLEQCQHKTSEDFVDVMRKMLPLLYLKVSLLEKPFESDGFIEHLVTEDDYNYVQSSVASVLKGKDDFLDVFIDDFKYSDKPVRQLISENLADAYQSLRNFAEIYKNGYEEAMNVALYEVIDNFELDWGQKILNALRALHDIKYGTPSEAQ